MDYYTKQMMSLRHKIRMYLTMFSLGEKKRGGGRGRRRAYSVCHLRNSSKFITSSNRWAERKESFNATSRLNIRIVFWKRAFFIYKEICGQRAWKPFLSMYHSKKAWIFSPCCSLCMHTLERTWKHTLH